MGIGRLERERQRAVLECRRELLGRVGRELPTDLGLATGNGLTDRRRADHLGVQREGGLGALLPVRGGVVRPHLRARGFEFHAHDVDAALLIQTGAGVLDLFATDDRLVQQVGGLSALAVVAAGDQGQVRVVVTGQRVIGVVAARGLNLQGQHLDPRVFALPDLLLKVDQLFALLAAARLRRQVGRRRGSRRGVGCRGLRRRCRRWRWRRGLRGVRPRLRFR
ncbi:Uncharacterised protein [Mycobacteroides abscessus subsp. massiliense]|nr:Uncharacterised protein [Mycobacteroides abscessus subsp. massiliense]